MILTDEEVGMLSVFPGLTHIHTLVLVDHIRAVESALLAKLRGGVELPEPAGYYEQEYIGEPSRIEARFDHDQLLQYGDARALAASEQQDKTDWKEIALQLAQRINFAVVNLEGKGGGMLDTETMKITSWREYMADGMELVPNVKVDREILRTLDLPKSKRRAAQAKIKADRAASPQEQQL